MNLNDYQQQAMGFRLASADTMYALLNLSAEVGELHSLVAKSIRDGMKEQYSENVQKELGDIMWMLAAIAADYNMSLVDIAQKNLDKLTSRKANGTIQGEGDER
jgi:NTP pyrophosphatase (non-canonical NTP hydrolase)